MTPPYAPHRLRIVFDAYGMHTELICPETGCEPAYDAQPGDTECWLRTWADNMDLGDEGHVRGSITVACAAVPTDDAPIVTLAADEREPA